MNNQEAAMKRPKVVPLKRWRNALMCDELFEEIVATRKYIEYLEQEVVRVRSLYDEEVAYHNP